MTTKTILTHLGVGALALLALPSPSQAAVATGTLLVSATVLDTCLVVATPLVFGNLGSDTTNTELVPSVVSLVCTAAKSGVTVTLDGGANPSDGVRQMSDGGTGRLPYDVYTTDSRTTPVAIGGQIYTGAITAVIPTTFSVYGTVAAATYGAGIYTDTATITLNY